MYSPSAHTGPVQKSGTELDRAEDTKQSVRQNLMTGVIALAESLITGDLIGSV